VRLVDCEIVRVRSVFGRKGHDKEELEGRNEEMHLLNSWKDGLDFEQHEEDLEAFQARSLGRMKVRELETVHEEEYFVAGRSIRQIEMQREVPSLHQIPGVPVQPAPHLSVNVNAIKTELIRKKQEGQQKHQQWLKQKPDKNVNWKKRGGKTMTGAKRGKGTPQPTKRGTKRKGLTEEQSVHSSATPPQQSGQMSISAADTAGPPKKKRKRHRRGRKKKIMEVHQDSQAFPLG